MAAGAKTPATPIRSVRGRHSTANMETMRQAAGQKVAGVYLQTEQPYFFIDAAQRARIAISALIVGHSRDWEMASARLSRRCVKIGFGGLL